MYRLNSLNADIQLIVDGAWESKPIIIFILKTLSLYGAYSLHYRQNLYSRGKKNILMPNGLSYREISPMD